MNVGNVTSMQSAVQESTETASQTKTEAAKGDQQAIRKLARQQAANNTQSAPNAQSAQQPMESARNLLDIKA